MIQDKSKNSLLNWEIVSVNPNDKSWYWKDLFCFWGNNIQSIIAFSLITSLYLVYELSFLVVLFGSLRVKLVLFASAGVLFFMKKSYRIAGPWLCVTAFDLAWIKRSGNPL